MKFDSQTYKSSVWICGAFLSSYVKPVRREFLGRKIYAAANAQQ